MSQKKEKPSNLPYEDHLSNKDNSNQNQTAALNALAAAYSLSPTSYSPFFSPYPATLMPFGGLAAAAAAGVVPNFGGGLGDYFGAGTAFPYWPGALSADYLLNMAALQQLQQQQSPTSLSLSTTNNNMPSSSSSSSAAAFSNASKNTEQKSSSRKGDHLSGNHHYKNSSDNNSITCKNPVKQMLSASGFSLDALAQVASCLQQQKTNLDNSRNTASGSETVDSNSSTLLMPPRLTSSSSSNSKLTNQNSSFITKSTNQQQQQHSSSLPPVILDFSSSSSSTNRKRRHHYVTSSTGSSDDVIDNSLMTSPPKLSKIEQLKQRSSDDNKADHLTLPPLKHSTPIDKRHHHSHNSTKNRPHNENNRKACSSNYTNSSSNINFTGLASSTAGNNFLPFDFNNMISLMNNHNSGSACGGGTGDIVGDFKMDPNLLNASAMAWAALSNQFLLAAAATKGLQQQHQHNQSQNDSSRRLFNENGPIGANGSASATNSKQAFRTAEASGSSASSSRATIERSANGKSHMIRIGGIGKSTAHLVGAANSSSQSKSSLLSTMYNKRGTNTINSTNIELTASEDEFDGKIVVDCAPKDTLDDTINAVIRSKTGGHHHQQQQQMAVPKLSPYRNRHHHHHRHHRHPGVGRPAKKRGLPGLGANGGGGFTVREQLALRRAGVSGSCGEDQEVRSVGANRQHHSTNGDDSTCAVLDLSFKQRHQHPPKIEPVENIVLDNQDLPKLEDETASYLSSTSLSKKRPLPETELVRVPLEKGWRRQTCIRSISASGIRGDVIYYAPCGRRLGSYAEVIRYMNKNKIRGIGREHFSFSCKVLVGEFLHVRPDSAKNGVVPLSENEVREMVNKFHQQSSSPIVSASSSPPTTSVPISEFLKGPSSTFRPPSGPVRGSNVRRRGRPATGGVPVYNAPVKPKAPELEVSADTQNKAKPTPLTPYNTRSANVSGISGQSRVQNKRNASTDSKLTPDEQTAKEEESRKNQLELLRKQEEEYMRQVMMLTDWEREKNRQQAIFAARALEAKQRQEKRKQIYAEKLIREEERIAARNAYLLKLRQQRIPVDDLEVIDPKPLPDLDRIDNLQLDGQSFADLLMVSEFVHNFGHVLKIGAEDIPSLDSLHAGLFNDRRHVRHLLNLTKILLMLVLEYPGLPGGPAGKTFLGTSARDASVNYDNMSELMRIFFRTRGGEGLQLSELLDKTCFEALRPREKLSMLTFMCNELLYCRNVVREIEANIDLSTKLKSDKWTAEGKQRHLKALQVSKQCTAASSNTNNTPSSPANQKAPPSDQKSTNEKSTPPPLSDENQQQQQQQKKKSDSGEGEDDETLDKVRLKIIAESEPISVEEKNMTAEEINTEMDNIVSNIDEIYSKMVVASAKVRILPLGQDRYHRFYWSLPTVNGLLVESLESGGPKSHVITEKIDRRLADDHQRADVAECLHFLLDLVCEQDDRGPIENDESSRDQGGSRDENSESRGNNEKTFLDIESNVFTFNSSIMPGSSHRRGWWLIKSRQQLDNVHRNLSSNGIRERHFARVLANKDEIVKRSKLGDQSTKSDIFPSKFTVRAKHLTVESINLAKLQKVMQKVRDLEEKIYLANVHVKTWKPPDSTFNEDDDSSDEDINGDDVISVPKSEVISRKYDVTARKDDVSSRKSSARGDDDVTSRKSDDVTSRKSDVIFNHKDDIVNSIDDVIKRGNNNGGGKTTDGGGIRLDDSLLDDDDSQSVTSDFSSDGDDFVYTSSKSCKQADGTDMDCRTLSEIIRRRTLELEQNVERRYLTPDFNKASNFPFGCIANCATTTDSSRDTSRRNSVVAVSDVSDEVGTSSTTVDPLAQETTRAPPDDDDDDEDSEDDEVPIALRRWRSAVGGAVTPAQFVMCLESLNSHIAWERSVMKAMCQICRKGDDDSHLLLCDGCDLGYHTYCFKPPMDTIPDGDWFCPECVSQATRRLCCLLCCRQTARPMLTCADCQRNFHCDCVNVKKPTSNWMCDGCTTIKTNSETIKKLNSTISSRNVNKKIFKRTNRWQQQQRQRRQQNRRRCTLNSSCGNSRFFYSAPGSNNNNFNNSSKSTATSSSSSQGKRNHYCAASTSSSNATAYSASKSNNAADYSASRSNNASSSCYSASRSNNRKDNNNGNSSNSSGSSSNMTTTDTAASLDFTELCSILLAELDAHNDSWPFKLPVDTKVFPLYKKIIKRPLDLSLIQNNLDAKKYENAEHFIKDLKQMFDNCKTFNEDDSPVGKAGHSLRRFFSKRWKELKEMSTNLKK